MSKPYFLATSRDTPRKGPIFIGSIIKSPRSPELSINGKKTPLLAELEIATYTQKESLRQLFKTSKGKAGIWAEFVIDLGISGNISGNWDNVDLATFKFNELRTETISPSLAQIQAAFNEDAVQTAIKDSRFRDSLYMITGIKIAKGAEVVIQKVRGKGGNLHFGLDMTPFGAPVKVGPDIEENFKIGELTKESHQEEFVWAYRLREVRYKRKQAYDQKEYIKGDLMGKGQKEGKGREERIKEAEAEAEAELIGFKDGDVDGDVWDAECISVVDDDGEEVRCVKFDDDDEED